MSVDKINKFKEKDLCPGGKWVKNTITRLARSINRHYPVKTLEMAQELERLVEIGEEYVADTRDDEGAKKLRGIIKKAVYKSQIHISEDRLKMPVPKFTKRVRKETLYILSKIHVRYHKKFPFKKEETSENLLI